MYQMNRFDFLRQPAPFHYTWTGVPDEHAYEWSFCIAGVKALIVTFGRALETVCLGCDDPWPIVEGSYCHACLRGRKEHRRLREYSECQCCRIVLNCDPDDEPYWICERCHWEQCPDPTSSYGPNHTTVGVWRDALREYLDKYSFYPGSPSLDCDFDKMIDKHAHAANS